MDVREKLVELLGNIYLPMMAGSDTIGEYNIPHKFKREIADYLISHGVIVQEWVPVTERLPEDSGYYLVVHQNKYNGSISIAFEMYIKCKIGEWWESEFACDITKQFLWATRLQEQEVTHWMPLPEPPKGE